MPVIILSSSPNTDGLTAACASAVASGLGESGVSSREIRLTDSHIGLCRQCDNGWGPCRSEHSCQVADGFQTVHKAVLEADALAIVTPVYFGEMSESMKAFTDRLRRCEATKQPKEPLGGKRILCVAAAGGSGGGLLSCLEQIERVATHIGMKRHDLIGVTRWTQKHQLDAIRKSARALGETLAGS